MALLVTLQERLVFVPVVPGLTNSFPITPARLRLNYEDVSLRSSDGIRLHAWFFLDFRGPTILFFQEHAGNIAHRLEMVRIMLQRLQFIEQVKGIHLNMELQRMLSLYLVVVFGRSLGGAVGTVVNHVAALIVENSFKSILDMAGVLLPFRKWFIGGSVSKGVKIINFVVPLQWNTIDIIGEVKQPILLLSGLQDEMIPPSQMQMLYAKAATRNNRCVFMEFPSGMHMDSWLAGGGH